jgi:hypothetical protein
LPLLLYHDDSFFRTFYGTNTAAFAKFIINIPVLFIDNTLRTENPAQKTAAAFLGI